MKHTPAISKNMTTSGQQLSVPQAMELAYKHYSEAKPELAEILLKRILNITPQHADALHLLGVITHQKGELATAINIISQAISIAPNQGQYFANLAEMCRQAKDIDKAINYGERAVALTPKSATAHSNLGVAYFDDNQLDKARQCQQDALALNPQLLSALNNLGSIARQNKDKDTAIRQYREVLEIDPHHLESINNLGATLTESEQPEEGLAVLVKAINIKPDYAEAHCNIANAFMVLEQLDKATIGFKKAIECKPAYSEAYQGLAKIYQEQKDLIQALEMANKALALTPDKATVYTLLGGLYSESGFPDKATSSYEKAVELDPDSVTAFLGKGHLLMEQGDMQGAEDSFRYALQLDESNLGARLAIAQVKKVSKGDDNFKALIAESKDIGTMFETKALPLHFALGKCYDDTKQYDLAFKHYLEGCRLKRKRVDYNPDDNDKVLEKIRTFFSKDAIAAMRGEGCPSDVPIFVLGMPRSGTTLTEQIIASHPDVHGAGELPDLMQWANHPNGWETVGYPASLKGFSAQQFKLLAEKYVNGLQERSPDAKHITDKMPANFYCIGLIHLMLPNAKIVHVKRNPLDTCLSGFSRLFNKSQFQSYDLSDSGRYYRNYFDLMAHWREVLPEGSFYEIQYEELVADTEGQAKALIDYCGLDWNDACLDFHKTERSIRTASVTQVRQPIYKTSVERWRSYQDHLAPLFEALGDLVTVKN